MNTLTDKTLRDIADKLLVKASNLYAAEYNAAALACNCVRDSIVEVLASAPAASPSPEYRDLVLDAEPPEILQEGDEYIDDGKTWEPTRCAGHVFTTANCFFGRYRRRVTPSSNGKWSGRVFGDPIDILPVFTGTFTTSQPATGAKGETRYFRTVKDSRATRRVDADGATWIWVGNENKGQWCPASIATPEKFLRHGWIECGCRLINAPQPDTREKVVEVNKLADAVRNYIDGDGRLCDLIDALAAHDAATAHKTGGAQ